MASYEYWEKGLANPAALHAREFSITTTPEPGFYRTKRMNEPVAIWEEAGALNVMVSGYDVDPTDQETVWLNCAKYPVSEAAYHQAVETGRWDDVDEVVASSKHDRRNDPENRIDELVEQAKLYRSVEDDETAQRAISLRNAILEAHRRADKIREEAKAPYLKSAREVDELWMPMVKRAKSAADVLRALVESWETAKRKAAREAEAARLEAERKGREPEVLEDFPPVCVPPQPQDQIRSGYGKAASVRTRLVVIGIDDIHKLVDHLKNTQWGAMHSMLMQLAQKDVTGGMTVPGVSIEEQAVVR